MGREDPASDWSRPRRALGNRPQSRDRSGKWPLPGPGFVRMNPNAETAIRRWPAQQAPAPASMRDAVPDDTKTLPLETGDHVDEGPRRHCEHEDQSSPVERQRASDRSAEKQEQSE